VRSAELRFEAEGGHRSHRSRRAQRCVCELEKGVSPRGQALMERRAKVGELGTGFIGAFRTDSLLTV
jgi:hypothetical protein